MILPIKSVKFTHFSLRTIKKVVILRQNYTIWKRKNTPTIILIQQ